jgi:transposase
LDLDRVKDTELLRQVAKVQDAEIRRLHDKLTTLKTEVEALKGRSPEEIQNQLALLEKELSEAYAQTRRGGSERRHRDEETADKAKSKQSGHGPTPQPLLPIVEVDHDLDEADKTCPSCGGMLELWEGQPEESEEVDVVELQYVLKKHRRRKYRCACGSCVETAPGPLKLIPGGRYSVDFAVHVSDDKFGYHSPLERQVRRMRQAGLKVTSQTLWDQTYALAQLLKPTVERLHQYLLEQELLLADESHWPLLGAKGRKTKNWFAWALAGHDGIVHKILDSRSNEAGAEVLRNFDGVLLTDGYVVYTSQAKRKGYQQAHCWAHARRYFLEAEASAPEEAQAFLDDIGALFGIEREIDEATRVIKDPIAAKSLRAQVRDEKSRPIVNRIGRRAMELKALPKTPIAQAVKYLENRWDGLARFVDDPRVPMTSNGAERALRGLVLGRNNHFGSRSKRGTEVAAIFYSLIESAKLNGLNPKRYLKIAAEAALRDETPPLPHELD